MKIPGVRVDPYTAFNFHIALLDATGRSSSIFDWIKTSLSFTPFAGGFTECTGLEATMEVEEYSEGGENTCVHKFFTRMTYSNITLKRGVTYTDELANWYMDYRRGRGQRKNGLIMLSSPLNLAKMITPDRLKEEAEWLPPGLGDPLAKIWCFKKGLPLRWTGPSLNASQSEVAIESLEIVHEGLEIVSAGTGLAEGAEAIANLIPGFT